MKAKLIVVGGTTSATEMNLRLPAIIGRGRSAQVTIPHSLVSRQHCEISEVEGRLVVRDLNSLNGTYVGDERITQAILEPGALLTIGTVTFRAAYDVGDDLGSEDDVTSAACLTSPSSSKGVEMLAADQTQIADADTVPVDSASCGESVLALQVPDTGAASEEAVSQDADAAQASDLLGEPSFESVAPNSD